MIQFLLFWLKVYWPPWGWSQKANFRPWCHPKKSRREECNKWSDWNMATGLCFTVAVATHENNGLWSLKYLANQWWTWPQSWSSVALFTINKNQTQLLPLLSNREPFFIPAPLHWWGTVASWAVLIYNHVTPTNQSRLFDMFRASWMERNRWGWIFSFKKVHRNFFVQFESSLIKSTPKPLNLLQGIFEIL